MRLIGAKSKVLCLFVWGSLLLLTCLGASAASLRPGLATCSALFEGSTALSDETLDSVRVEGLSYGRSLGEGAETVVFQSTWNGRKATLRLFHGMDMKTKLIYSELSAEEKARLARLDWREAVRLLKELNTDERAEQGYTSFELAALEQATAINRLVQSRRMQGLRYQGREIVPGLFALVRNAEGLIVGLISEYVPGKDFEKLVNQKALTEAEIDQVIDQAIEQIRILGRKGFYHGDPGGGNILVTKGRGAKLIARLIDFSTDEFLPLTGQANWEGDIEALEHQRKKMKAQLRPWYGGNGRMLDVLW